LNFINPSSIYTPQHQVAIKKEYYKVMP